MAKEIEIDIKLTGVGALKSELKDLKSQLANATDPVEMERLARAAGQVADQIKDINEQVAVFAAGSEFEKVGNGLSLVGGQLASLDFKGAADSARLLTTSIKGIDPKAFAGEIKGLISTVGSLSKAFIQMGIKLLLNPLFLLVAVIGAIIAIIVGFKDKIKILEKAFDYLMAPINMIIDALKKFGDWLGLTSFAADEAAEKHIKANDKLVKSYEERNAKVTEGFDREIRLAKISGQETEALEIDKQKSIRKYAELNAQTTKDSIDTIRDQMSRSTREQKKELQAQLNDLKANYKEQTNIVSDSSFEITALKAQAVADDKVAEQKAQQESAAKRKQYLADKAAAEQLHVQTLRKIKDIELSLMDEGVEKDKAIVEETYQRNLKDLENTKIVNADRLALQKAYLAQRDAGIKKANVDEQARIDESTKETEAKAKEEADALLKIQEDYNNLHFDRTATDLEKQHKALKESFEEEGALLKANYDKGLIDEEAYQIALAKLRGDYKIASDKVDADNAAVSAEKTVSDNIEKIDKIKEQADKVLAFASDINNLLNALDVNRINDIKSKNAAEDSELEAKKNKDLSREGITAEEKASIENKFLQDKYKADVAANTALNAIKKKEFNRNKALSLANIAISTAEAIAKAVALSPLTGGLPFSAIAAGIGAIQLGAVAATKFQGDSGPSAPALVIPSSGGAGGSNSSEALQPSFNLFGKPNQANNVGDASAAQGGTQNITVTAVVSETQITQTQANVAQMQKSAEL